MNDKLKYEKPVVRYWSAEDLDSVEAAMSGGGGGGSTSTRTVWYSSGYGGALLIHAYSSSLARVRIYKAGLMTVLLSDENISGNATYRVLAGYGFDIKACFTYTGTVVTSCQFNMVLNRRVNNAGGAKWEPDDWGIRPARTPICRMRWYITAGYSSQLLQALEDDFIEEVITILQQNAFEMAVEMLITAYFPPNIAWSIASGLRSLLDIFGLVQRGRLIQIARENQGMNYVITVFDYGDGGSPSITSRLDDFSWDGEIMYGEEGYDGEFFDNV